MSFILMLLLVLAIIGFVAWALIKGLNIQMTLIISGALMFGLAYAIGYNVGEVKANIFFFMMEKLQGFFSNRLANLGLIIMSSAGFAYYMKYIGAVDALVDLSIKPLRLISNPYILGCAFFVLGNFLQMFITSAAGLGVLLMTIAYPILRNAGLSAVSAAAFIAMTGVSEFGPTQTNAIFAAETAKIEIMEYVIGYQTRVIFIGMLTACILAVFWFSYLDKKDPITPESDELADLKTQDKAGKVDAPRFYALLPLMPFALLLTYSKYMGASYNMSIVVAVLISVFSAMLVDLIRTREFRHTLDGYDHFLKGMASVFTVVTLIVAAEFFAQGLLATQVIAVALESLKGASISMAIIGVVLVLLIVAASFLTGSGNASFLSLGHLAPEIAAKLGVNVMGFILPMQIASSTARAFSPISGIIVAVSGMAKISPFALVKRTVVPLGGYIIVATLIGTFYL